MKLLVVLAALAVLGLVSAQTEININFANMLEGLNLSGDDCDGDCDDNVNVNTDMPEMTYSFYMSTYGFARRLTYWPEREMSTFTGEMAHVMSYSHWTEPYPGQGFPARGMGGGFWWCGMNDAYSAAPNAAMSASAAIPCPGCDVIFRNTEQMTPSWNIDSFPWSSFKISPTAARLWMTKNGNNVGNFMHEPTKAAMDHNMATFNYWDKDYLADPTNHFEMYLLWHLVSNRIVFITMNDPIEAHLAGSSTFSAENWDWEDATNTTKCWGRSPLAGNDLQGYYDCQISGGVLVDISFELPGAVNPNMNERMSKIFGKPKWDQAAWGGGFPF